MDKVKVALIGAGQRGKDVYGEYALEYPQHIKFVAVAEPKFHQNISLNLGKIYYN